LAFTNSLKTANDGRQFRLNGIVSTKGGGERRTTTLRGSQFCRRFKESGSDKRYSSKGRRKRFGKSHKDMEGEMPDMNVGEGFRKLQITRGRKWGEGEGSQGGFECYG